MGEVRDLRGNVAVVERRDPPVRKLLSAACVLPAYNQRLERLQGDALRLRCVVEPLGGLLGAELLYSRDVATYSIIHQDEVRLLIVVLALDDQVTLSVDYISPLL